MPVDISQTAILQIDRRLRVLMPFLKSAMISYRAQTNVESENKLKEAGWKHLLNFYLHAKL